MSTEHSTQAEHTLELSVNGEASRIAAGATVADLVVSLVEAARAGNRGGIAVAVNETVVPRASWDDTRLAAGDRVEILTAVQGG